MNTQALVDVWQVSEIKQASEKADQSTFGSGVMIISLLIELSIDDDEICTLPLCAKWNVLANPVTFDDCSWTL